MVRAVKQRSDVMHITTEIKVAMMIIVTTPSMFGPEPDSGMQQMELRMATSPLLTCIGWWDQKCSYESVCVGFLYTVMFRVLSSFLVKLSRGGIHSFLAPL